MTTLLSIAQLLILALFSYTCYLLFNHGVAHNAKGQQARRFLLAALCAHIPLMSMQASPLQPVFLLALLVAVAWMVSYPLIYHLTFRKSSPDYDNHMDTAFGLYVYGWLTGLAFVPYSGILTGLLAFVLLILPVFQWVYYLMYQTVVDERGIKLIQDTDYNETIEFLHSYPKLRVVGIALCLLLAAGGCIWTACHYPVSYENTAWWAYIPTAAATIFMLVYSWKPKHGIFVRTGLATLWHNVAEYAAENNRYSEELESRLKSLTVTPLHPADRPSTTILIIGESANRDYMSAFSDISQHTTPWMEQMKQDKEHFFLFPNAYSCDVQTVPTLEQALTERNQYNGKPFYQSCSIIDIAHKLGYQVHWYSNQGHLGVSDTPITLVAATADVAKWTKQELNQFQYDGNLLDFLQEVDPTKQNLVVLHLIGSHFNFENRFPEHMRQWGKAGVPDNEANYLNALHYTDYVLQQVYEYGRSHLNMDCMVYFSDHATVPDHHRIPKFMGYWDIRIPMTVWVSDDYATEHPQRVEALRHNAEKYWTNDLLYELMCGLMDVQSNNFDETASIASDHFRFTVDMLTTMNGNIRISDNTEQKMAPQS